MNKSNHRNEEKALLENGDIYRNLVQSINGYFYNVQFRQGKTVAIYHSPQCEMITGYTQQDYKDDPDLWLKMVHEEDKNRVLKFFRDIEALIKRRPIEHRIYHKDGSILWVANHCTITFGDDGEVESVNGLVQDITERKRAEEELFRAKEKAEEATALKDKFVALVAHDLRGPLVTMSGFLKLFSDDSVDQAKKGTMIERVMDKTNTILQLIDDLLKISRLKTGTLQLNSTFMDARFPAAKALCDCVLMAEQKGIALENNVPRGSRIYGDCGLLNEVLHNLVSNAIKFSYRGTTVTIFMPDGEPSTIAVADTGIGIRPEHIDQLFSYDAKTSTKGTEGEEGTGMGLPLSLDIMKAHGGTLEVESTVGKGSVFKARLPHARPKILVVDDKDARRQALDGYLQHIDVDVMETMNASFAMGIIEKTHPHLIISDFESPDVDGPGLLASIKKNPNNGAIPFLAIIASPNMKTHDLAFRLGASDCISNPLEPEEIIPRIRRFIG